DSPLLDAQLTPLPVGVREGLVELECLVQRNVGERVVPHLDRDPSDVEMIACAACIEPHGALQEVLRLHELAATVQVAEAETEIDLRRVRALRVDLLQKLHRRSSLG